jgi:hypothetical protein
VAAPAGASAVGTGVTLAVVLVEDALELDCFVDAAQPAVSTAAASASALARLNMRVSLW